MTRTIPILLAMLVAACAKAPQEPPAQPARPAPKVEAPPPAAKPFEAPPQEKNTGSKPLSEVWPAIGSLSARQTTRVGPQVSGRIKEVLVDVGDRVKKDQPIVRLDPAFFEIELAQREADLEAAKVALAEADLNYTRMKNLWERPDGEQPSIPRKLYDDAKSRLDAAAVRIKQVEVSIRWAQERLRETVVGAPFDGVVTKRLVDAGQSVTTMPVTELIEVQDVATLELEFSLPQEMLGRVKPGSRVEFESDGVEGVATGAIEVVFPVVDPATRAFRCRVLVDNRDGRLRPGLFTQVRVTL